MAGSHVIIKPVRHAGIASQDSIYISGAAIVEGAPVVFSSGKVIEATDGADGMVVDASVDQTKAIVGIALNAASAANQDVLVALALPGRMFVASHGDNATSGGADGGTFALALADIGSLFEVHKDTTETPNRVILGAATAGGATKSGVLVVKLIDKVGAKTTDTRTFGEVGSGPGVAGTPPNATFTQDPPSGPNFGTAREAFVFLANTTIFGVRLAV
jgi:hypothetical protein